MFLHKAKVKDIEKVKKDVYRLSFKSEDIARKAFPGQFLHIKIKDTILRRPFSIHKVKKDEVFILFKLRGRGTRILSSYKKNDTIDVLGPLGNGFDIIEEINSLLVAGGIGVAPLVFLAQRLIEHKRMKKYQKRILLGAKTKKDILCKKEFQNLGFKVNIATEDGSEGFKGTVVKLLENVLTKKDKPYVVYACGPQEMMFEIKRILRRYPDTKCQVSLESFMGCGTGVCRGCVIDTISGYKRVCKEGPVFDIEEIK